MKRTLVWALSGLMAVALGFWGSQWLPSPHNQRQLVLTDMDGQVFDSLERLKGEPYVVTFGYTYCPDVCPTTLAYLAQVLDVYETQSGTKLDALFVSVDPERDTPDRLAQYVAYFDADMTALTGSAEQLKQAAQSFSVYFQKVDGTRGDDYLVDHSAGVLVLNGAHQLVGVIRDNAPLDDALAELAKASP